MRRGECGSQTTIRRSRGRHRVPRPTVVAFFVACVGYVAVASFVYVVLALGSIAQGRDRDFVPHLSITGSLALVLVDLVVLVYFIHHVATTIQLPQVIASIASDLTSAIDVEVDGGSIGTGVETGLSETEVNLRLDESGVGVHALRSGYVQFIGYPTLGGIAADADAVVRFLHRPGHVVTEG
jgi:uncharacterized membrane protein